ncbi:MAG: UDP-N-acetylmuramoyl-L-alanine--D-glutamate ligase, partial [Desulfobacterales bacterium]
MQLSGKKIAVVGLGASGTAVAAFLARRKALVTATDSARAADLAPAALALRDKGVKLELGGNRPEVFADADMVVISPGVPHDAPSFACCRERGIPVIGEVELAARFIDAPIVAITGTNGKTTTTTLVGEMLRRSGIDAFVGGNIGTPLISYVDAGKKAAVVVAEISSFQLDTIERFRPKVAVVLNIAEDHLDRYPDFNAYARSKARIFENQGPDDFAVLNGADDRLARMADTISARKLFFSRVDAGAPPLDTEGALISETAVVFRTRWTGSGPDPETAGVPCSAIKLFGGHN